MREPIPFVDLRAQHMAYRGEIDAALAGVLDRAAFILGPEVAELETALAAFTGAPHAIACASGTDALLLSLMALGIGPGDEVIVPPFTFFATAEAVSLAGATPVFVDIEPAACALDPALVGPVVTPRTRAVIPVGLYGQPADMEAIGEVARRYGLAVIEDAAQSFGATCGGRRSCNLSELACTSFFPAKPLGCYGDGGAVFAQDGRHAALLRELHVHGQGERYCHRRVGLNSRLDTLQAAVLLVKLRHLDDELARRQRLADRYTGLLAGSGAETPVVLPGRTSAWAQYSIRVPDRAAVQAACARHGVPTAVHYPVPLYRQQAYARLSIDPARFPVTEDVCRRILSLPISAFLSDDDQQRVVAAVREGLGA